MSVSPDAHSGPNVKNHMTPTVDSEREEFRKYLENGGVLDVIYRILKDMYEKEERPEDPLVYFTTSLGAVNYNTVEIKALKDEIHELKLANESLQNEVKFLRAELDKESAA